MIEIRWKKIDQTNELDDERLKNSTFVGNAQCVLQFREVFKDPYSQFQLTTEWQDVKIGEST